jgi:hypothetical protein
MAKIPNKRDCGPDADEYAGDRGEARQAARRGDEDYSYGRSRHADGPYHFAELSRMEGYPEW